MILSEKHIYFNVMLLKDFAYLIEGPNKIFSKSGPWAEKSCEALL